MAFHTLAGGRECHQFTGFRIGVAILAFQAKGEMFFVAVGDGLLGSGVPGGIVGDHLLCRGWRRLLRGEPQREEKKRSKRRKSLEQRDISTLHPRLLTKRKSFPSSLLSHFLAHYFIRTRTELLDQHN